MDLADSSSFNGLSVFSWQEHVQQVAIAFWTARHFTLEKNPTQPARNSNLVFSRYKYWSQPKHKRGQVQNKWRFQGQGYKLMF